MWRNVRLGQGLESICLRSHQYLSSESLGTQIDSHVTGHSSP